MPHFDSIRSTLRVLCAVAIAALLSACPNGEGTDATTITDSGPKMQICQVNEESVDDGRPGTELDTCVRNPVLEAELCNVGGEDFCDATLPSGTSPNLGGCLIEVAGNTSGGDVTMHGVVDLFGEANSTLGVMITIYAVDDVGGTAIAGPVEARTACTTAENASLLMMPAAPPSGAECAAGFYCLDVPAGTFCGLPEDAEEEANTPVGTGPLNAFLAYYTIDGIPTDVPLVAKQLEGNANDPLVESYQYDVFLPAGTDPATKELNIITFASWTVIPTTTPVGAIPAGHGVVAGTINDCDDIRIANATVGFSTNPGNIAYFNGVFDDPTPMPGRTSTNLDGIYAGLDLEPGTVRLHARALVGGTVMDVGGYDIEIFPDAVTLLTLRGRTYTP